MSVPQKIAHVSSAPTNPQPADGAPRFDVADLYRGPVATEQAAAKESALDERLRQAYFWIVNNAIISPHYDIEYDDGPAPSYQFGSRARAVR